jgi:SRSO17 transposase
MFIVSDKRSLSRDYVLQTLADDEAVLVIDETGFLKQGKASCGVARQYTGSAGKITNCQICVFATHVSHHGHAFYRANVYRERQALTQGSLSAQDVDG